MAGEIARDEGICLDIRPWSRTSHVVSWLTRIGRIVTIVKGAARPKSAFLGQYDLNYTCEILYYLRSHGEVHALRECSPLKLREAMRGDYRALALGAYFRWLVAKFAPSGPDAAAWYELLADSLDALCCPSGATIVRLLRFELKVLELLGLHPELEAASGSFVLRGERTIPISPETADFLRAPTDAVESRIPLDAARVIGVFYTIHLDCPPEGRRAVLKMLVSNQEN